MLTAVALLVVSGANTLGPPLRQDGFQLRPPANFRMARMDLFHGTQVGAVGGPGYLSAALVDGDGENASSLLLAVVDTSLSLGPSSRDTLSTAVVKHFNDMLAQPFALERAEVVSGRVQVLGSIRQGSQLRRVMVAAWPGDGRHVVAVASVTSGRWDELAPQLAESFESLRVEAPVTARPPRQLVWAAAALAASLLLVSVGLWRRRQAARQSR